MTRNSFTTLEKRPYALRFNTDVPAAVIEATVREANEILTAEVGGFCFYSFETEAATVKDVECLAAHLHADNASWTRFRARGVSMEPLIGRSKQTVVAGRKGLDDLLQRRQLAA